MMIKNQNSTSSQFERHVSNMLGPNMLGPRAERRAQSPVTCLGPIYTADWANRRRANNVEIRAGNRHPKILPQKLRSRRPAGLKRVAQIPWQGHNQEHRPAIVCTQTPVAPVQFEEYNWAAGGATPAMRARPSVVSVWPLRSARTDAPDTSPRLHLGGGALGAAQVSYNGEPVPFPREPRRVFGGC